MRTLSPYELNHLLRHGLDPAQIAEHGEMPVEYITGAVTFCGHEFQVSPAVLIPRVETEELVAKVQQEVQQRLTGQPTVRVIDVGCGSGAIGLSVWLGLTEDERSRVKVMLSDTSPPAIAVARQNWQSLTGSANTIILTIGNLLLDLPDKEQRFDIIVANLPYIPQDRLLELDASVKDYEPELALVGGEDGLDIISELLQQAPKHLTSQGVVWLEVDHTHTAAVLQARFPAWHFKTFTDHNEQQRLARASLKT